MDIGGPLSEVAMTISLTSSPDTVAPPDRLESDLEQADAVVDAALAVGVEVDPNIVAARRRPRGQPPRQPTGGEREAELRARVRRGQYGPEPRRGQRPLPPTEETREAAEAELARRWAAGTWVGSPEFVRLDGVPELANWSRRRRSQKSWRAGMGIPRSSPPASPEAVQTAIVRACEICSAPVQGRRPTTCSDRCRAERWRRGQEQVRVSRDARVLRLLREAIRLVEEQAR